MAEADLTPFQGLDATRHKVQTESDADVLAGDPGWQVGFFTQPLDRRDVAPPPPRSESWRERLPSPPSRGRGDGELEPGAAGPAEGRVRARTETERRRALRDPG